MKKLLFLLTTLLFFITKTTAQVGISATNTTPNASAMLDVSSTDKGLLIPRMTTVQKNAIAVKPTGLMVFDITLNQFSYWNTISWINVTGGAGGSSQWITSGNNISNINSGNVGIGNTNPINKLDIGLAPNFSGNELALGNGTQGMSFSLTPAAAIWYTNTNFAMMPASGIGYLGIGTTNPIAPLHITSNSFVYGNQYAGPGKFFDNNANAITPYYNSFAFPSILTEGSIITKMNIMAFATVVASDSRIKKDLSLSNNSEDLERLKKIQITNYRMKDVATWGTQTFKKVIAQQVEEVYPEVIKRQTAVIPDIYALAESVNYDAINKKLSISLSKDYGIKIGDKIELVHPEKGKIQAEVVEVLGKSFTVKNWEFATDKIFVFGREVNDFRSVDYEALSMLGISVIQQLAKEIENLKKTNSELNKVNEKNETRFQALESALKTLLPSGK
jgi:Chaperone of endosialidase